MQRETDYGSSAMLTRLFFELVNHSPRGRRIAFRSLFEHLARRTFHVSSWTQMNYGYAGDGANPHTVALAPEDEQERFCHQLYLKTVDGLDLRDREVVEVSCGRGGGASFVHRYLRPRTLTGVDIAQSAVEFCRRVHRRPGLRFVQGDAEELPLFDESADAIINVEASFCYGDMSRFLAEVRRVLRPGGVFLYADLRHTEELPGLDAALAKSDLEIRQRTDITRNVVRALELDGMRRMAGVTTLAPRFMRHAMKAFAGAPGSRIPTLLATGRMRYQAFVLQKLRDRKAMAAASASVKEETPCAEAA